MVTPVPDAPGIGIGRRTPINNWTDAVGHGTVIAMDPTTGQRRWTFEQYDVTDSGILTTATDLLFTGGREGYFYALDARTGKPLWSASLGGQIVNGAGELRDRRAPVHRHHFRQRSGRFRVAAVTLNEGMQFLRDRDAALSRTGASP